ncbi:hypothetical protein B4O97_07950 [Marispirochaeta aestuarii]|uniref:Alginate export domain-containing protein n=1 Tax=Marispirochaeta aestuarii TaxID=1963862 RepID=A0A1Y1RZB6_9SPIO|nr:hypothetical protein [Marispirochaeta aestuarii]ORC35992.1 hypothetical protein B4O97_07950 [Marispirochaeta aestuarii]
MKQQWILLVILTAVFGAGLHAEEEGFNDGSFFEKEDQTVPASSPLEIGGRLELSTRYAVNDDGFGDGEELLSVPELRLDLDFRGKKTDIRVSGRVEQIPGEKQAQGRIDEAYLRYYARYFDLEIGYMKPIWGPGDKVHAVDILTPMDYSDFINPDYAERKEAEAMIKLNIPAKDGLLELVYLPVFTPDTIPWEGTWVPRDVAEVQEAMTFYGISTLSEEETADFSHSSFAFRYTESIGSFDLGGIYYLGYYRQPTVNIADESLSYDQVNMVGIHGTAVAGELTLRAEAGWYATGDYQGDDPEVRNSEFRWVGGFDCNLPVSRININIQETGTLLLNSDAIESPQDVQINSPTTENMLILCIRDSWNRNTVEPELKFILGLEDRDYLLKPSIKALFHDELEFSLAASIFGGDEGGNFGHFDERDFIELSFSCLF